MATVVGKTSDAIDALVATLVVGGAIDSSGNLTLTLKNGSTVAVGNVGTSVPAASETIAGILKIATSAEITAGTDDTTAVSPLGLEGVVSGLNSTISGKQPLDSDLTAIAALAAADNDVIQHKAGAWTNRTPTQLAVDLQTAYAFSTAHYYSGSAYISPSTPAFYVGSVDPGSVPDGTVWFDTSGA